MIISVASGKGGTGKTLVATSLAVSLAAQGMRVQLLDCDVEEPNAHLFLRPQFTQDEKVVIPVPRIDMDRCWYCGQCAKICAFKAIAVFWNYVTVFPELCHGCGACSYICPQEAISEEEREIGIIQAGPAGQIALVKGELNIGESLAPPVIRAVKQHAATGDVVIIDAPPGTSCPMVEAVKRSDCCLLVTEPTPFGQHDLGLAVEVMRTLGIPCGVIINRDEGDNFQVEQYCHQEGLPIWLRIPFETEIAVLYSQGVTLAADRPEWQQHFQRIFGLCENLVAIRRAASEGY